MNEDTIKNHEERIENLEAEIKQLKKQIEQKQEALSFHVDKIIWFLKNKYKIATLD